MEMVKKLEDYVKARRFRDLSTATGYILTKNKSETFKDKWRCVEKQTLPNLFTKKEALEIIATHSFSGKEIKVYFEIVKIENGSVKHCYNIS